MSVQEQQQKLRQNILSFPDQFKLAFDLVKDFKLTQNFDQVLVCGMGGSAWPAEIYKTWVADSQDRILVHRNYNLPPQLTPQTLIVLSSYSGNTEETVSAYRAATDQGLAKVVISSGGQLKEFCQKDKTAFIEIPAGLEPRMATGYLFTALAGVINQALAPLTDRFFDQIKPLAERLKPSHQESKGQEIAQQLQGKIPIIYSSEALKTLAFVWKIKLNEGAKIAAFSNFFPELNHNEFSAYDHQANSNFQPYVLIFRNSTDHPQIIKRINLTAQIIESNQVPVKIIDLVGHDILEKIFSSLILSDWVVYYLAQAYNLDPLSTKLQEAFKKKLN